MRSLVMKALAANSLLIGLNTHAVSQWDVDILEGPMATVGRCIEEGEVVGEILGVNHAFLWHLGGSWTDLHPAGATRSDAWGTSGGFQAGAAMFGGNYHAASWAGSAASFVDLNPPTATRSAVADLFNLQHVGYVDYGTGLRAVLWTNRAPESAIDLHPIHADDSTARSTDGVRQVGWINTGSASKACVWSGTQSSYVDLHPGQYHQSLAFCVNGDDIGGFVRINAVQSAAIWSGPNHDLRILAPFSTAPPGYVESSVMDLVEGLQVGNVSTFAISKAGVWEGTPGTWHDLEQYLPVGSDSSFAHGVTLDGEFIRVAGHANIIGMGRRSVVWSSRISDTLAPTGAQVGPGVLVSGTAASVGGSDDLYLSARPGPVFSTNIYPIQVTMDGVCSSDSPSTLEFAVESRTSTQGVSVQIWLYNFATNTFDLLKTGSSSLGDTSLSAFVASNASVYVQPLTLAVRAKVSYRAVGPVLAYPWTAFIDRAIWKVPTTSRR